MGTFRLADVKHVVDTISGSTQFPIADAAALETALGGADSTVPLGAEQHRAAEVRQIPADFFPIDSAADLYTKLAFLRSANGDQPTDLKASKRLDSVPEDAGPPPPLPSPHAHPGGNVPSARS
jgi:hypothetical protein